MDATTSPMTRASRHPVSFDLGIRVIPFAVGSNRLDVALALESADAGTASPALPSGTLDRGETLAAAAARIARTALSVAPDYLEQLYTFSLNDTRAQVIVAYFGLLSADTRQLVEGTHHITFQHVEHLDVLPSMERHIVTYAKTRLRAKLGYSNVAFHLLPREFTLSDLQDVYESVFGHALDKRNFRRRVLAAEIVESVGVKRPTNHRPATLYRFTGGDPTSGALTPGELDWRS